MKRLTTDTPGGNFETMLNFVYGNDGWAHIRHDGERPDVPLTEWANAQCIQSGCDEASGETQEIANQLRGLLLKARGKEDPGTAQNLERALLALSEKVKEAAQ